MTWLCALLAALLLASGPAWAQLSGGGGGGGVGIPLPKPIVAGACLVGLTSTTAAWLACSGSGTVVNQVGGTSGQITVSPTTGNVVVSLPATITSNETFTGTIGLNGTVSGAGLNTLFASPPSIGNVAPSTGKFSTLQDTGLGGAGTTCVSTDNTGLLTVTPGCATPAPGSITYGQLQNENPSTLLGRQPGTAGSPQEITLGANLAWSGSTINVTGAGGIGTVTSVGFPPGTTLIPGTKNTGTQAITSSGVWSGQSWPVAISASCTVNSNCDTANDSGDRLIASAPGITFTMPNPSTGTKGNLSPVFASDGANGFTVTTAGGTAQISGCAPTAASTFFQPTTTVQLTDTGTAYSCDSAGFTSQTAAGCVGVIVTPASGIQNAINANPAGTTFCLTSGTFTESQPNCYGLGFSCTFIPKQGATGAAPEVFVGAGIGLTIISGSNTVGVGLPYSDSGANSAGFIVSGMTFTKYTSNGLYVVCNTNAPVSVRYTEFSFSKFGIGACDDNSPRQVMIVENSIFHDITTLALACSSGILSVNRATYIIRNNDFYNNNTSQTDPAGGVVGDIGCTASDFQILNNVIHGGYGNAFWTDTNGVSGEIAGNEIYGKLPVGGDGGTGIALEITYPAWVSNGTSPVFRIHDNYVHDNATSGLSYFNSGNIDAYHNTVADNGNGVGGSHWPNIVLYDEGYRKDIPTCVTIGCVPINISTHGNFVGVSNASGIASGGVDDGTTLTPVTSSTVSITAATPAVATWTGSAFSTGQAFSCTSAGTLTGFTAATTYYVSSTALTATTFEFATSLVNAQAGTPVVNTGGSTAGSLTCTASSPIAANWKQNNNTWGMANGYDPSIAYPDPNFYYLISSSSTAFLTAGSIGSPTLGTPAAWQALGLGGGYGDNNAKFIYGNGIIDSGVGPRGGFICLPGMGVCSR